MFEVPQQPGAVVDGHNDDHPLNLNISDIKNADFRHLLVFLYDQDEIDTPASLEFFLLGPPSVHDVAHPIRSQICYHPSPAIQLRLSRQYNLDHWVVPAFQSLMQCPISEITLSDAEHMGVVAYHKLAQFKWKVADFKTALAFHPPDVSHSFGCLDENVCSRVWETFWWGGYAKQLLHPDNKIPAAAILLELDPTKGLLSHMNRICLRNTMDSIWENNPFSDEQGFVDDAEKDLT
ncbi:hypothetical protein B0H14DRAFT_2557578 [Mycena olivaceomarginata]|nr:hypothetical protein B0H14DRAFT_2557578 [Mycena olivaceomarginata]